MRRRIVCLVIAALAAASGALMVVLPASAATGCAAEVNGNWQLWSMSRGDLTIMSVGQSLPEWTLRFQLRYPNQQIKNIEGVRWEQRGGQVTVRNLPGSGLPAGVRMSFQFLAINAVWYNGPTAFTLNGVTCTVGMPPPPPPSPSLTPGTPSPTPSPSPLPIRPAVQMTQPEGGDSFFVPATIAVRATATPTPGRAITRVEFSARGDTGESILIGTDTTAPYTAEWRDVPANGYWVQAQAYDDHGASQSAGARIRVLTPGDEIAAPYVSVVRDRLWGISPVTEEVTPRRLAPLARTGAEARCVHGRGIWDGPVDATAVARLAARGVKAVYLPLNEACWLGLSYVDPRYGGEPYRQEIVAYTALLMDAGITPIVALAWSHGAYTGPGASCRDERAVCAKPMPDAEHAIDFWQSVSSTLYTDKIVYDLFPAPYPDRAIDDPAVAWACWRDGGQACSALGYPAVGMDSLLDALRTDSVGVALLGGLNGGNDLSQWAAHRPDDWWYNTAAGWRPATLGGCRPPALAQAPVVVTAACR